MTARLGRVAVAALAVASAAATAVLLARRWSGCLIGPAPAGAVVMGGAAIVAAAAVLHRGLRLGGLAPPLWREGLVTAWALAALYAVSLPDTAPPALALVWTALVAAEGWAWRGQIGLLAGGQENRAEIATSPRELRLGPAAADDDHARDDPSVQQQLTRTQAAEGDDVLSGWMRVAVAAGARTARAHVAFCPPFPETPRFEVQQIDGPEAAVKIVQLLAHGARMDVKLHEAAAETSCVTLEFSAQCPAAPAPAAALPAALEEVAVAVVQHAGRVLIGRRGDGGTLSGFWEFPGGRLRPGETPRQAAVRECREETGLKIRLGEPLPEVIHAYEHAVVRLHFFLGEPAQRVGPVAEPFRWVPLEELPDYPFPPANAPILERLRGGI